MSNIGQKNEMSVEVEIIRSNISAIEYDQKVVRLINAIIEAQRLLALKQKDSA